MESEYIIKRTINYNSTMPVTLSSHFDLRCN
jgi:hypothetical protein